jgi:hypothetical protein
MPKEWPNQWRLFSIDFASISGEIYRSYTRYKGKWVWEDERFEATVTCPNEPPDQIARIAAYFDGECRSAAGPWLWACVSSPCGSGMDEYCAWAVPAPPAAAPGDRMASVRTYPCPIGLTTWELGISVVAWVECTGVKGYDPARSVGRLWLFIVHSAWDQCGTAVIHLLTMFTLTFNANLGKEDSRHCCRSGKYSTYTMKLAYGMDRSQQAFQVNCMVATQSTTPTP